MKELRESCSANLVIFKKANGPILNLTSPKVSFLVGSLIFNFSEVKRSYKLFKQLQVLFLIGVIL